MLNTAQTAGTVVPEAELRSELHSLHSDMFKDRNGIRPRWLRPEDLTVAEWEAEIERLAAEPLEPWDDCAPEWDGSGEVDHVTESQPTSGDGWAFVPAGG